MFAPDSADAADAPWPALDRCFLQKDRRAPPSFPLDVVAPAWRPWIEGHAQASSCVDYIALALLASVSAVCGSRTVVDVTPHWREPLVPWLALVGAPSTGKTPAMIAARRLLAGVTAPPGEPVADELLTTWLVERGISLWYDEVGWLEAKSRDAESCAIAVAGWSGDRSRTGDAPLEVGKRAYRFPESIFGILQADRLADTLDAADEALLSRFLYGWPVPGVEARLDGAVGDADTDARALLQRLVDLPGFIHEPDVLTLQPAAAARLQALLPRLRAFMRDTDGLDSAWIGKGAGNIVRLAGLLTLMDWAAAGGQSPCTTVEEAQVERAYVLWNDYFWPHAQSVFGQASLTVDERRVRRVGHWLRRGRPRVVSREEVRREALAHSVDAETAEGVIERLEQYGALRMLEPQIGPAGGRPRRRWQVNPELWAG